MISEVMRIGLFLIGLLLMVEVFLLYAKKRLTVDIAMAWEAAGTGIIVVSAVPALSRWCGLLSAGTAVAVFLCGLLVIWAGLRFSILLSVMQMKVQELAVQVSLLKEENLQLMQKVEEAENRPGGGGKHWQWRKITNSAKSCCSLSIHWVVQVQRWHCCLCCAT